MEVPFVCDQLQSFPAQPHYLSGFEVLYRSLMPISSDWAAKTVTLPRFQAQVGPLKRGYKYEFKVRPYGSNLYGRESNTQFLRVPEKGLDLRTAVLYFKMCFDIFIMSFVMELFSLCSSRKASSSCVCYSQLWAEYQRPSELGTSSSWKPQWSHSRIPGVVETSV